MAFIGKNVIENLTTAMYENLMIVYREYIQNSADSIDKAIIQGLIDRNNAIIDVEADPNKRYISIEDNGAGISAVDFQRIMSSIADSTKDSAENKGFRGIGRLGGISACRELRFSCSAVGENVQSIVTWDAKKVREILNDDAQNPDASTLVDIVTNYDTLPYDTDKHFFKVELIDIEQSASELLDETKIKRYLRSVAPLPYLNNFIFSAKIHDFVKENGFIIDEYNVFVNGDRLFKDYRTRLYEEKSEQKVAYDEIIDVKFEIFNASNGDVLGWMWYGICRFEKQIPVVNEMRGIRLRKGNIQIGNEQTFFEHDFFKEPRGYLYLIGEVFAVHSELRPNARRDYFNLNDCCREFEHSLRDLFYNRFYSLYHLANQYKKAYQKKLELAKAQQEYQEKEQNGFDSPEDKQSLEEKIEDLTVVASKADKTIETRDTKEAEDDVLSKVYGAIKNTYNIPQQKEGQKAVSGEKTSDGKNPYKNKPKFKSQNLTQYSKKEQKLIGRIYGIVRAILPHDMADIVVNKIQEELSK